jgi:hypothetical protein
MGETPQARSLDVTFGSKMKKVTINLDRLAEISLNPPFPKECILLKDGGNFIVAFVDRESEYNAGDVIKLSPLDLSEICMVVTLTTQEILTSAVKYMESIGINVIKTEQGHAH